MYHIPIPDLTNKEKFNFRSFVQNLGKNSNECHLWSGAKSSKNARCQTPVITIRRIAFIATRIAYKEYYGVDPGVYFVCHNCFPNPDNSLCCNPKHLWLGTNGENQHDYHLKGGIPSFSNLKVSDNDVEIMRKMHLEGIIIKEIAKKFNISEQHTRAIVHYRIKK